MSATNVPDLPFDDDTDFEDADRGFVGALEPGVVTDAAGRVVWDNDAYGFLADECPDTAHPSLWRQGQLVSRQGLFQVCDGIYQVRGLDLSNMTLVEGDTGVIVIDPLISAETAAAALALYRTHRGDRPVTAVIYTHAHVDHFGGVRGVLEGDVPILAPDGFMESAVSENVYAGVAMSRRAVYMYGAALTKGPAGQIGCGLGMTNSTGTVGLVAPTVDITRTGQEEVLDGVRIVFQLTPGTECPAEMNFHFPDRRALCMAENATRNLHNLVTLRGAVVRDARVWAAYLDEAIDPVRRRHRRGVRLPPLADLGRRAGGRVPVAPARPLRLPARPDTAADEHRAERHRGGRGDGHAAGPRAGLAHPRLLRVGQPQREGHLPALPRLVRREPGPPVAAPTGRSLDPLRRRAWAEPTPWWSWRRATRPRATSGSPPSCSTGWCSPIPATRAARGAAGRGLRAPGLRRRERDLAELLPDGRPGTAQRDRRAAPATVGSAELLSALTVGQLLDAIAIRINGPRAWDERLTVDWRFTDLGETHRATLGNGVLTHRVVGEGVGAGRPHPDAGPRPRCSASCSVPAWTGSAPTGTSGSSPGCSRWSSSPTRTSPSSRREPLLGPTGRSERRGAGQPMRSTMSMINSVSTMVPDDGVDRREEPTSGGGRPARTAGCRGTSKVSASTPIGIPMSGRPLGQSEQRQDDRQDDVAEQAAGRRQEDRSAEDPVGVRLGDGRCLPRGPAAGARMNRSAVERSARWSTAAVGAVGRGLVHGRAVVDPPRGRRPGESVGGW